MNKITHHKVCILITVLMAILSLILGIKVYQLSNKHYVRIDEKKFFQEIERKGYQILATDLKQDQKLEEKIKKAAKILENELVKYAKENNCIIFVHPKVVVGAEDKTNYFIDIVMSSLR